MTVPIYTQIPYKNLFERLEIVVYDASGRPTSMYGWCADERDGMIGGMSSLVAMSYMERCDWLNGKPME